MPRKQRKQEVEPPSRPSSGGDLLLVGVVAG